MRPTLKEVAKKAEVSIATVSRFLKDKDKVSLGNKRKIEEAICDLGFKLEDFATISQRNRLATIALIVPDIENPFFASIVKIIELFLSRLGYALLLGNSSNNNNLEEKYLEIFEEKKVNGILLIPSGPMRDSLIDKLNNLDIPLIVLDRKLEGLKTPLVMSDNLEGGEVATRYLINLGRKRIAFISGRSDVSVSQDRMKGYLKALKDNSIPFNESMILEGDFSFTGGYEAASKIAENGLEVDAIFAANDFMALGAIDSLRRVGIKVPEEISVIGYDDIWVAKIYRPSLTTIRQPIFEMCELAVNILIKRMDKIENIRFENILKPELIVRESCSNLERR